MRFCTVLTTCLALFLGLRHANAQDTLSCTGHDNAVVCNLSIPSFVNRMAAIMTNGWENAIVVQAYLQGATNNTIIRQSTLQASQRCYLDPFESPCLLLWRGAKTWITYKNEMEFLNAFANFNIQVFQLKGLAADNYRVRVKITISTNQQKQQEVVKQWFRQSGSDTSFLRLGDTTLVGSFMSAYAISVKEPLDQSVTLETTQFYLDPEFKVAAPVSDEN